MTLLRFIETNILIRQIIRDQAVHADLTDQLFLEMAAGTVDGLLSMTVVFETAYSLNKTYGMTRQEVTDAIELISRAAGIQMFGDDAEHLRQTLRLYLEFPKLSFADCYHSVLSIAHCNGEIYTFDKDFSRVPGVTRLEPGQ